LLNEEACDECGRTAQRRSFRPSRMDSKGDSHVADSLVRFRRTTAGRHSCRLSLSVMLGIGISGRLLVLLGPCGGSDPRPR
jgi:hypothetical protein